jgi:hypothetical protein
LLFLNKRYSTPKQNKKTKKTYAGQLSRYTHLRALLAPFLNPVPHTIPQIACHLLWSFFRRQGQIGGMQPEKRQASSAEENRRRNAKKDGGR